MSGVAIAVIVVLGVVAVVVAVLWARSVSIRTTNTAIAEVAKAVEASIIVEVEKKRLDIVEATKEKSDRVAGMSKDELEREINK